MPTDELDKLWDFSDPAGSGERFRMLMEAGASGRPAGGGVVVLTQWARALGLQRRFEEAMLKLDEAAAALLDVPESAAKMGSVLVPLERGRVIRSSGKPEAARPYFEAAFSLAVSGGEEGPAVDAAHMIALVSKDAEQEGWTLRALEMAATSTQPRARRWKATLLHNLAWNRMDTGRFEEALDLFRQTVVEREARGEPKALGVARWSVARALRSLGRHDEALEILQTLGADGEGYVAEERGENLWAMGKLVEARALLREAWKKLSGNPWLAEHEAERLDALRARAGIRGVES